MTFYKRQHSPNIFNLKLISSKTPSTDESTQLLNCRRLPGRINTTETAIILGFGDHDIAPLIAAKLLTPLGKPKANAPKYFSSAKISKLANDLEWLGRATQALSKRWKAKNARRAQPQPDIALAA